MATLTYDPTDPTQPEFSEDELDSLAVGERMQQEQDALLAGKYQDAQELEKAYLELQQKLGERNEPQETEGLRDEEEAAEEEVEEGEEEEFERYELTDGDIEAIHEMAGGEQEYNNMINWAGENLSEQEINMFDYVMDLGDPYAIFFAVRSLLNSYQNSTGVEGELLTGKAAYTPQDVFRSQAEVVAAMEDPRYDRDPAYRQDVFNKLDRSNLQF
jgi:hypothetical protein